MKRSGIFMALGLGLGLLGCGDDAQTPADAGDAGIVDSGELDSGVRALCPVDPDPACTLTTDCEEDGSRPSNCPFCEPINPTPCILATCQSLESLAPEDIHNFDFTTTNIFTTIRSFGGMVFASETSGGKYLDCSDVYGDTDYSLLRNGCLNVVDSRSWMAQQVEVGGAFRVTFARFPANIRALFVVYGFEGTTADGSPIAVTCKEFDVGAAGSGPAIIAGDTMEPIQ